MFSKGISTESSCKHHLLGDCSERQFVTAVNPQSCDPDTEVAGTRVYCSFPQTYLVLGSNTQQEITWVDTEPILHLQDARCFFCFLRTELMLCIRLFCFVFSAHIHIALSSPKPGRSGMLEGAAPTANPFLPSLAFLQDYGMSFLSAYLLAIPSFSAPVLLFPISAALWHTFFLDFLSTHLASQEVSNF